MQVYNNNNNNNNNNKVVDVTLTNYIIFIVLNLCYLF